jgi:hypothetical protein
MTANSMGEGIAESTPCSCVGPCAGYGSKSGCPSLLVMVTLIAAKDALAASLHGGGALIG